MPKVLQKSTELQSQNKHFSVKQKMAPILDEANKKFSDAIYRIKNNDERTAEAIWVELRKAQNTPGWDSGMRCISLLNELTRRGQIKDDWRA